MATIITDGVADTPTEAFEIVIEAVDRRSEAGPHQVKNAMQRAYNNYYEGQTDD